MRFSFAHWWILGGIFADLADADGTCSRSVGNFFASVAGILGTVTVMANLNDALWRDMMGYLRRQHPSICRQWFEELEPLGMKGGLLLIYTGNRVHCDYLQSKCLDYFIEAAQAITGALVAVRFTHENNGEAVASDNGQQSESATTGTASIRPSLRSPSVARSVSRGGGISGFDDQMVLSPDYSFDNFITGPNNQLAYAASVAVANQPGVAYNPLFIHGGVGLGKTHLLQAICQKILENEPQTQILYVSCDSFMNQFIECVQNGQMHEFRHRYRHVDMLVIDDIHFLANRERSQEEFFHTFNDLYQSNRQIVLSSDASPAEIPHMEERLVSRFQWGLVANVSKPSFETRVAIVRAKAKLRDVAIPDDVVNMIASRDGANARELEGAINTLLGHAALQNRPIDIRLAREALGESLIEPRINQVTLQHIIDVVTEFYSVRLSDLQSRKRHKSVTEPRQVCMWLARKHTRFSLEEVGGYFGGRDHTTVMHSIRTIDDRITTDPTFTRQINLLDDKVRAAGMEE